MNNSPINELQQLFVITAEECGELTQRCSKMIRKYSEFSQIESDQRQKFVEEAGDVYCMLDLLEQHGVFTWDEIVNRAAVKRNKLKKWSTLIK